MSEFMDPGRNLLLAVAFSVYLTCLLRVLRHPVRIMAPDAKGRGREKVSEHAGAALGVQLVIDVLYIVWAEPPVASVDTLVLLVVTLINLYMVVGDESDLCGALYEIGHRRIQTCVSVPRRRKHSEYHFCATRLCRNMWPRPAARRWEWSSSETEKETVCTFVPSIDNQASPTLRDARWT